MTETDRQAVIDLIFGDDGLKPGVAKLFLDPFHQDEPGPAYDFDLNVIDLAAYDHATKTEWMRYFIRAGLQRTRARGDDLSLIVTLYGPPGWMTRQKFVRGRDLDPQYKHEVAKYLISWAKYLRDVENFPVHYVSVHNEGEDWRRWPADGSNGSTPDHDYNMYWPPEQVVDFMRFMPDILKAQGMDDVGVTPGETSNWPRFYQWGYADALANDPAALHNIGLITSHGFGGSGVGMLAGRDGWHSTGIDILRQQRPDLHAWVTSTSWSKMDVDFVNEIRNNIYIAKVNAIIPWAAIQVKNQWIGGDPNPGCAFQVSEDGSYAVQPGYHFYKQVSRAGQPGMAIAQVASDEGAVFLIGFASNGTRHPNALVVINVSEYTREVPIRVYGSHHATFEAFRTSPDEQYVALGQHTVTNGVLTVMTPARSVTTFYGVK